MKFIDEFTAFQQKHVNINQTRIDLLNSKSETIIGLLKKGNLGYCSKMHQGSWHHKTIVKPINDEPFDADLVIFIKEQDREIIKKAGHLLKERNYDVVKYNKCVTVTYANDLQIDIIFMVKDTHKMILNDGTTKDSYFNEFRQWILERNNESGFNNLRKVIKLAKYIRRKHKIHIPSMLLTTILGLHVTGQYEDFPTAFYNIFDSLNAYLQENETRPDLKNPVDNTENVFGSITDNQYVNLRSSINKIFTYFAQAYISNSNFESVNLYSKVLGENFRTICGQKGKATKSKILDLFRIFKHMKPIPDHKFDDELNIEKIFDVHVTTFTKNGSHKGEYKGFVRKGISLKFEAPVVDEYYNYYQWRVTNTGIQAKKSKKLRGTVVENRSNVHTEPTKYIGTHFVECFLMSKDHSIVAKSQRIQVSIVG